MRRALPFLLLGLLVAAPASRAGAVESGWREVAAELTAELDAIPPGQKVVYLSGPVSTGGKGSVEANLAEGLRVSQELREAGYTVISPFEGEARIRSGAGKNWKQHATFMKVWSAVLRHPRVDELVLLPGADSSVGATVELGWFVAQGRPVSRYRALARGGFRLTPLRYDAILSRVEHTLLKPEADARAIWKEARWAGRHGLRAMVVRPEHMETTARAVHGTATVPTSVLAFPMKAFASLADFPRRTTAEKLADAARAIDGAARGGASVVELDMILDVHALKAGDHAAVERDIRDVIAGAREHGAKAGVATKVKVIVETSLLEPREVAIASRIVRETQALAIKTSTGFGPRGASAKDVRIMRRLVGDSKLIKVSGGVTAQNLGAFAKDGHIFGMSRSRELRGAPRTRTPAPGRY